MKKIISILLISVVVCSSAFAVEYMSTDAGKSFEVYQIVNPSSATTGGTNNANLITAVSTSTIVPGTHRIIGFDVMSMDTSANSEKWVSLSDTTSALFKATAVGSAPTGQFAEIEANDGGVLSKVYA
jgi:hypothetical protein